MCLDISLVLVLAVWISILDLTLSQLIKRKAEVLNTFPSILPVLLLLYCFTPFCLCSNPALFLSSHIFWLCFILVSFEKRFVLKCSNKWNKQFLIGRSWMALPYAASCSMRWWQMHGGLTCCSGSSHIQIQQQDVCTYGGFYHRWSGWYCQIDPKHVRHTICFLLIEQSSGLLGKMRTHQNPSPLHVAILFESLWLHDIQNIPFLPCWRKM